MFKNKKHQKQKIARTHPGFDKSIISWRAPEYAHHEKSALWFVIAGLIVLALAVWGVMSDGWTFSIAILVLAGTYYAFHPEVPAIVEIKISRLGVKIGKHAFPYGEMRGFWIVYNPPFIQKLYLKMHSKFHPDIFVELNHEDPALVRQTLAQFAEELPIKKEPFADSVVRLLKL